MLGATLVNPIRSHSNKTHGSIIVQYSYERARIQARLSSKHEQKIKRVVQNRKINDHISLFRTRPFNSILIPSFPPGRYPQGSSSSSTVSTNP